MKLASIFGETFKRLKINRNSRFVFRQISNEPIICLGAIAKNPREAQRKSTSSELNLKLDPFSDRTVIETKKANTNVDYLIPDD